MAITTVRRSPFASRILENTNRNAVIPEPTKQVIFATQYVRELSEYDAHLLAQRVPEERTLPPKAGYEVLRTDAFVVYGPNHRQKTVWGIKIARANAVLAARLGDTVAYDGRVAAVAGRRFVYADRVQTAAELGYHSTKYCAPDGALGSEPCEVIALSRSTLAPYIVLDRKTLRRYYEQYRFPDWFRPFVKMRHFRFMLETCRFAFQSRRYTDSKHTMDEKLRHDLAAAKRVAKCYFSLARVADSLLEREGKGRPLDCLLLALDVDASRDHTVHRIDARGLCSACMASAARKLARVRERAPFEPARVVFSGTKGYHCHFCREVTADEMLEVVAAVNGTGGDSENEPLVDDFTFVRGGERRFDMHRIFKVPGTVDATTACVVDDAETPQRLPVRDQIARLKV